MSSPPLKRVGGEPASPRHAAPPYALRPDDLDVVLQKLKLLEFGLYGLQQFGRSAQLDVEDLGPFYRLAEEIASDVLALQARLSQLPTAQPGG